MGLSLDTWSMATHVQLNVPSQSPLTHYLFHFSKGPGNYFIFLSSIISPFPLILPPSPQLYFRSHRENRSHWRITLICTPISHHLAPLLPYTSPSFMFQKCPFTFLAKANPNSYSQAHIPIIAQEYFSRYSPHCSPCPISLSTPFTVLFSFRIQIPFDHRISIWS